jgi:hypothetical protein
MQCMKRAQAQLASQVEEIMQSTVGDDQESVKAVVNSFNTAFPQQEDHPDDPDSDESYNQPLGRPPK